MLFYKLNESMRHLLYFLLLVCFLGNIKAQKSVGQVNGFYVCSKTEDYNKFIVSDYRFYDKSMYEKTDDSIRSLFVHYRWIKYNQNVAVGKHCVLDVKLNDTVSWAKNKLFLEQTFPYMATREETNELEMINMQVPIDLSLEISFKLNLPKRYNRKNKYDGWSKGELAEIKSITNMIRSSYLYDDINSILKKYKLTIDNVRVTEPTLAFTPKKFLDVYSQYSNKKLPRQILGLYITLVLKPCSE